MEDRSLITPCGVDPPNDLITSPDIQFHYISIYNLCLFAE